MTILLTGGLGKTTSRIAALLSADAQPILIATRSGNAQSYPAVKFNWTDRSSWDTIFEAPQAKESPITAVYLVVVGHDDPATAAIDFIKLAQSHGVKRFVLLSSSAVEEGDASWYGQVHAFLKSSCHEWAVLRPSWFMQNFSEIQQIQPVKAESRIVSATGDGKVPFVDAEDIAAVGAKALTITPALNKDVMILGPELLSFGDVAEIFSEVLGRNVSHTRLTQEEMAAYYVSNGESEGELLAYLEKTIEDGAEARLSDDVQKVLGRPPRSFREFAEKSKALNS